MRVSSSSCFARGATLVVLVAAPIGCGFRASGTGSGATLGDSATPIDSTPELDAGDVSFAPDGADGDPGDADDTLGETEVSTDGDAACAPKVGDLCKGVGRLPGSQILDGIADDFCGVEETVFDVHDGEFTDPVIAPTYVSAVARVHVAWSTVGLHFHFSVTDATFFPTPESRPHWQGDSVELFISGNDILTGAFDGVIDRGTMQIVFVPASPSAGIPPRAGIYYKGETTTNLPDAYWISREIPGGYEVEVGLPWDFINGYPPFAAGKKIGIDFAVNDVVDTARTQYFYSVYRIVKPVPAGSCGVPFCDDRVWCKAPLGAK